MFNEVDIKGLRVIYQKINYSGSERGSRPREINLNMDLGIRWGIYQTNKELTGIKYKIFYFMKSEHLSADVDFVMSVFLTRKMEREELEDFEAQKICIRQAVPYIIQLIAEMTEKLGLSPMIIDKQFFYDIIQNTKKPD